MKKCINEYYLGKNRAVAVVDNQESRCQLLNDSDIVVFVNNRTLDFDDKNNLTVAAIEQFGYYLFPLSIV